MKEATLYKKLPDSQAQCLNCGHYCVLGNKEKGKCGVRQNIGGKIYSLVYGKVCSIAIDPIEKKPLFHFMPGSKTLSLAAMGCQFKCKNCQNWQISQAPKTSKEIHGQEIKPQEIVEMAKKSRIPSISYTYTDPIVFSEYALDTMKCAKEQGLKNIWVTSGFFSKELFDMAGPYIDAANVDLKYFSDRDYKKYSGGRLQPVLDTLKRMKTETIWVEVTTLIIPTISDKAEMLRDIARFIKNELGEETPWHVTQFSASLSWVLKHLPDTPVETLKSAWEIGKEEGLKYVYTGNVPGLLFDDTFCPECATLAIERWGYSIKRFDKNGKCQKCKANLNILDF